MAGSPVFSEHCIYTIVHVKTLDEKAQEGNPAKFIEKKAWTTGEELFRKAQAADQEMAIIFGDAANCDELIYWGVLDDVKIKDETTTYTVKHLKPFAQAHTPQELILRSTGEHIAPNFIRPYAICRTPGFLA